MQCNYETLQTNVFRSTLKDRVPLETRTIADC